MLVSAGVRYLDGAAQHISESLFDCQVPGTGVLSVVLLLASDMKTSTKLLTLPHLYLKKVPYRYMRTLLMHQSCNMVIFPPCVTVKELHQVGLYIVPPPDFMAFSFRFFAARYQSSKHSRFFFVSSVVKLQRLPPMNS